jgi:hypothetical protein
MSDGVSVDEGVGREGGWVGTQLCAVHVATCI